MNTEKRPHVYVVAALIERAGLVLLDRRAGEDELAGLWEFPGGKRELGESDEGALRRELKEELGVACTEAGPLIGRVEYAYEAFDLTLALYAAEIQGTPEAKAAAEIAWHPLEALPKLAMPPANQPLCAAVLARSPGPLSSEKMRYVNST